MHGPVPHLGDKQAWTPTEGQPGVGAACITGHWDGTQALVIRGLFCKT